MTLEDEDEDAKQDEEDEDEEDDKDEDGDNDEDDDDEDDADDNMLVGDRSGTVVVDMASDSDDIDSDTGNIRSSDMDESGSDMAGVRSAVRVKAGSARVVDVTSSEHVVVVVEVIAVVVVGVREASDAEEPDGGNSVAIEDVSGGSESAGQGEGDGVGTTGDDVDSSLVTKASVMSSVMRSFSLMAKGSSWSR